MGGGNSRQNMRSPEDWQQDNEKIGRLSHLLALKSEHRDIVASRGWDKTQKEMVCTEEQIRCVFDYDYGMILLISS